MALIHFRFSLGTLIKPVAAAKVKLLVSTCKIKKVMLFWEASISYF
jgi:hypothetical protein